MLLLLLLLCGGRLPSELSFFFTFRNFDRVRLRRSVQRRVGLQETGDPGFPEDRRRDRRAGLDGDGERMSGGAVGWRGSERVGEEEVDRVPLSRCGGDVSGGTVRVSFVGREYFSCSSSSEVKMERSSRKDSALAFLLCVIFFRAPPAAGG